MTATIIKLTDLEKSVLKAIKQGSEFNGGSYAERLDVFRHTEEYHNHQATRSEINKAVSSLEEKKVIRIDNKVRVWLNHDVTEEGEPLFTCALCDHTVPLSRLVKENFNGHGISERLGFKFLHGGSCGGRIAAGRETVPFEYHDAIPWSDSREAKAMKAEEKKSINDVSDHDYKMILAIVKRASRMVQAVGSTIAIWDLEMDLINCHVNGCPLDLFKLFNSESDDFAHDIAGIRQNINRETGKLENCFVPRSSI